MSNNTLDGCQSHKQSQDMKSMPDITGVGVLIGFIAPAYFLLFIVCVYYIITYDPKLNPYKEEKENKACFHPNPFDQLVLQVIRRLLRVKAPGQRKPYISKALQDAFNKCVLLIADTQVITGLAILIGGYVSRSDLAALHWKMIVYLVWFSCTTHLSTLVFLRRYLIEHPAERWWRLVSMSTLLLLCLVAMVPTGHFYWDYLHSEMLYNPVNSSSDLAVPYFDASPWDNATCYFNSNFDSVIPGGKNSMIISMLLMSLGFSTKLFKLHRRILWLRTDSISQRVVGCILRSASFFQKYFGISTLQDRIVSNIIISAHMTVCIWVELYASMASDVYWLIVSVIWGTMKVLDLRVILDYSKNQDNSWSFGQVLPVLLLALPLINLIELFLKSIFSEDKMTDLHNNHPTQHTGT
ncbi:hypothetical protein F4806DRAFT_445545 [Annulohypoxylon nitens]|nr:hypothetical protein F4806DRAFT_445545 [Annulohypoxylon nitens]